MDLYLEYEKPLQQSELDILRDYVKRYSKHEPIQYIIGKANFFEFELDVNNSVLIPRPETEEWTSKVIDKYADYDKLLNVLEIGVGSGAISLAISKKLTKINIVAIDISEKAIAISKKNFEKYEANNIELKKMDILNSIPKDKFDLILSNPPYISEKEYYCLDLNVKNFEPKTALIANNDGMEFFDRFYEILPEIMSKNGEFFFETSYDQKKRIEKVYSDKYELNFMNDSNGLHRVVSGKFKNS